MYYIEQFWYLPKLLFCWCIWQAQILMDEGLNPFGRGKDTANSKGFIVGG